MTRYNLTWEAHESIQMPAAARQALVTLFEAAREEARAGAMFSSSSCPPARCRYCGRFRAFAMLPGTRLDGHVVCAVTPGFMMFVLDITETGTRCRDVERALGMGAKTVRAWITRALELRAAERDASGR